MSTQGIYCFLDNPTSVVRVYKHWDNYPKGALSFIKSTLNSQKTWELPRFEASEFATAFIAVNKERPGDIRLFPDDQGANLKGFVGYIYWINYAASENTLHVEIYEHKHLHSTLVFSGTLEAAIEKFGIGG